jgi:hypothetical protein
MKITKEQLSQLIKEEMSNVLNTGGEQSELFGDEHSHLYDMLDKGYKSLGYYDVPMDRIIFFVDLLASRASREQGGQR